MNNENEIAKVTAFVSSYSFIKFDSSTNTFTIFPSESNVDTYYITVVVTDPIYSFLSSTYTLEIDVQPSLQINITTSSTNSSANSSNSTVNTTLLDKVGNATANDTDSSGISITSIINYS